MTPKGNAFLALWNDVEPARDAEYNCWHTFEHVPERVGIPGILSASRYIAREREDHRYFTLYDVASLETLASAQYMEVAEHPTAWSLSMRPSLRNFLRRPCETLLRAGHGLGNCIASFRFTVATSIDVAAWSGTLQLKLASPGVSMIQLGRVDTMAGFPLRNSVEDAAAKGTPHVLLVEGIDRAALDGACHAVATMIVAEGGCDASLAWESYDFAFAIDRAGLPGPADERQPPREDLRRRWSR